MTVILQQDVKNLGKKGDIVNVSDGYARNFLIPRGLVVESSQANIKAIKDEALLKQKRDEREKRQAQEVADKLKDILVKIPVKTGEKGRLFGSITVKDIADALLKQGIEVDRKNIKLTESIKNLGEHKVAVKLHPDVSSLLNISVIDARLEGDK
jgi:large subunit ribosomal protein L9